MRRLLIVVVGLCCSLGVANEVDVNATAMLDQAVSADPQIDSQATAEAAREALNTLLNGVQVEPVDMDDSGRTQEPTQREESVRDEPSVARIPRGKLPASAYTKFAALRDKLRNTYDVVVLVEELQKFVDVHPSHREARITLGRLEIILNKPDQALKTFAVLLTPALAATHPDWQPWFWAGTAHLALGDIMSARDSLDVAVAKNGGVADIWVQLAVIEQEVENHAGALQYVAIAEQLDPNAAGVHLNRAYSLEQLGRFEEALQAYQKFLISDMNNASKSLRPMVLRRIATIADAIRPELATYKSS